MLKRQSKIVSLALIFCFCMSFMFVGFVAPPAAEAAASYRALTAPTFSTGSAASADFATVEVDIPSGLEAVNGDILTLSFPKELTAPIAALGVAAKGVVVVDAVIPNADFVQVVVPILHPQTGQANGLNAGLEPFVTATTLDADSNGIITWAEVSALDTSADGKLSIAEIRATYAAFGNLSTVAYGAAPNGAASAKVSATGQSVDIKVSGNPTAGRGVAYVYLNGLALSGASGDINVSIMGSGAAFAYGNVTVGKVISGGGTNCIIKSEKSIGTAISALDTITLMETTKASLVGGNVVKFKLPQGFEWSGAGTTGIVGGNWDWIAAGLPGALTISTDAREATLTMPGAAGAAVGPNTTVGRFDVVNAAIVVVDEAVAKKGDVVVRVSGTGNVTEQDLIVAKYGDFEAKGVEGTVKEIIAGKHDQKIGEFWLEETIANSLIDGREVKMTLPKGVKWSGDYDNTGLPVVPLADAGNASFAAGYRTLDTYRTLAVTVNQVAAPATPSKSKFKFKDLKVDVAPDFVGPITVTFSGSASATGEVKVADVIAPVELSAENVKNVRIGEQNQELGTLIIKETKKENIARTSANIEVWDDAGTPDVPADDGVLTLTLPNGAEWSAGYPTVEVTEGDLVLKTNDISKNGRELTIPVKSESTAPSTIKVSGLKATVNRTVPEGDFKVAVSGLAINETGGESPLAVKLAFPQYEAQKVVVANCVTPAPGEGTEGATAGQFKIDSNIYQVNGVSKVMDVAPYVKSNRTYIPVRYLGYVLGVADADVVWDEASQKATLTKGDNVVELTINSTTITVNGEAQTMDVAPEIVNNRTMLPARYVAEGLGYVVGWDPGTRTVLVSK